MLVEGVVGESIHVRMKEPGSSQEDIMRMKSATGSCPQKRPIIRPYQSKIKELIEYSE